MAATTTAENRPRAIVRQPGDAFDSGPAGNTAIVDQLDRMTAQPDSHQTGDRSAGVIPDDIEQGRLACINCGQRQWINAAGTRCLYCATDQPSAADRPAEHRGPGDRSTVERRCDPGARILSIR